MMVPVIFVNGYPERLLTGTQVEHLVISEARSDLPRCDAQARHRLHLTKEGPIMARWSLRTKPVAAVAIALLPVLALSDGAPTIH